MLHKANVLITTSDILTQFLFTGCFNSVWFSNNSKLHVSCNWKPQLKKQQQQKKHSNKIHSSLKNRKKPGRAQKNFCHPSWSHTSLSLFSPQFYWLIRKLKCTSWLMKVTLPRQQYPILKVFCQLFPRHFNLNRKIFNQSSFIIALPL